MLSVFFRLSHSGLFVVLTVLLSGCLFGNRQEPTVLFPTDSLSRQIASTIPVDTLRLAWRADSARVADRYLNTVQYAPDGTLRASDLLTNQLVSWSPDGLFTDSVRNDLFAYPYLVGTRADTLAVFSAGSNRLHFMIGNRIVRSIPVPETSSEDALSASVVVTDSLIYFKALGSPSQLIRLDMHGMETGPAIPLTGPVWRYRGLLGTWGDAILSLSAYRPVLDVLRPGGGLDTLALVGFDSPMLARSRAFVRGDDDTPPLMISSAVALDSLLFVLNLRPGIIRIDAYDRSGRLQHIAEYHDLDLVEYTPQDLDVREAEDGTYQFAVASVKTQYGMLSLRYLSRLDVLTWPSPVPNP